MITFIVFEGVVVVHYGLILKQTLQPNNNWYTWICLGKLIVMQNVYMVILIQFILLVVIGILIVAVSYYFTSMCSMTEWYFSLLLGDSGIGHCLHEQLWSGAQDVCPTRTWQATPGFRDGKKYRQQLAN